MFRSTQRIARQAMLASLYVVLVMVSAPLSFGDIQFRISEMLVLLIFFKRENAVGIILGCFLANLLFSPILLFDLTFGVLHTVVYTVLIMYSHSLVEASVWPVVTMPITAIGIHLGFKLTTPFVLTVLSTVASQFIVMVFGLVIFNYLQKLQSFNYLVGSEKRKIIEGIIGGYYAV